MWYFIDAIHDVVIFTVYILIIQAYIADLLLSGLSCDFMIVKERSI